jgi:hypothetical protein
MVIATLSAPPTYKHELIDIFFTSFVTGFVDYTDHDISDAGRVLLALLALLALSIPKPFVWSHD